MKLNELLNEARRKEDISLEKAEELLRLNCKDAIKHFSTPLWRGGNFEEDAYLLQPELGTRRSANTANYYTIIMDEFLPKLGYPKRSASMIFGNNENYNYTVSYGETSAIFPYDGVKIGVCEKGDIWQTTSFNIGYSNYSSSMAEWNKRFGSALHWSDSTYKEFIADIKSTLENPNSLGHDIAKDIFGAGNVETILKTAYSAENLNLELATTKNIYNIEKARELWVGGKCIAIKEEAWKRLKDKFR